MPQMPTVRGSWFGSLRVCMPLATKSSGRNARGVVNPGSSFLALPTRGVAANGV